MIDHYTTQAMAASGIASVANSPTSSERLAALETEIGFDPVTGEFIEELHEDEGQQRGPS